MSVSAIPDLSTLPTPAAAECTQRSRRAGGQQVGGDAEAEVGLRLARSPPAPRRWRPAGRRRPSSSARARRRSPSRPALRRGAAPRRPASAPSSSTWRRGRRRAAEACQSKVTDRMKSRAEELRRRRCRTVATGPTSFSSKVRSSAWSKMRALSIRIAVRAQRIGERRPAGCRGACGSSPSHGAAAAGRRSRTGPAPTARR